MSIRVIKPLNGPDFDVEETYLLYLDKLRDSGVTNMFGAAPYIKLEFPHLTTLEARYILSHWMQTFAQRHHIEEE